MDDPKRLLFDEEIADANLLDWRRDGDTLTTRFKSGSFAVGLEFVNRIGESAEAANHHPDIRLTYPSVALVLTSHDVGGITIRDTALARVISEHANALGIASA